MGLSVVNFPQPENFFLLLNTSFWKEIYITGKEGFKFIFSAKIQHSQNSGEHIFIKAKITSQEHQG